MVRPRDGYGDDKANIEGALETTQDVEHVTPWVSGPNGARTAQTRARDIAPLRSAASRG